METQWFTLSGEKFFSSRKGYFPSSAQTKVNFCFFKILLSKSAQMKSYISITLGHMNHIINFFVTSIFQSKMFLRCDVTKMEDVVSLYDEAEKHFNDKVFCFCTVEPSLWAFFRYADDFDAITSSKVTVIFVCQFFGFLVNFS